MSRTGADLFLEALSEYGADRLFGNPGTTELPVMTALADSDVEYALGLHEDVAVGMAAGYAKTRRHYEGATGSAVGVVNLHVAPGTAHGLGNLYGAWWTGAPLVVTAGEHALDHRHEEPILSGDMVTMTDQFTKWSDEVTSVEALPTMLRRAFRVALTPPTGPVFLALPVDVMMTETDADPEPLGRIPTGGRGEAAAVDEAADLLVEADEPVVVVGDEVARADATDAAVEFAEALGARVHGEVLPGQVDFPTDHDQWASVLPTSEEPTASFLDTDTLVFVGCRSTTTSKPRDGPIVPLDAATVHVGPNAWELGKNHPADVSVLGDPGEVMAELADRLADRLDEETRRERLDDATEAVARVHEMVLEWGHGDADADDPRLSKAELADAIDEAAPDAYVVNESVTAGYPLYVRREFEAGGLFSNSGGGLGFGLPASVGAAMAESERANPREVLGYIGDGAYLYYPNALYSAARYDLDVTVVVADNRNYRILKDNTMALLGGEEDDYEFVGMDFDPGVDIPANAESNGARGRVADPDDVDVGEAIRSALDREGPDVLDVPVHD